MDDENLNLEEAARAHGLHGYFKKFPEEIARAVAAAARLTADLPPVAGMALEPAHTFSTDTHTLARDAGDVS